MIGGPVLPCMSKESMPRSDGETTPKCDLFDVQLQMDAHEVAKCAVPTIEWIPWETPAVVAEHLMHVRYHCTRRMRLHQT